MRENDLVGPVVVHTDDTIRYANEEFCRLVGAKAPAECLQRSFMEFVRAQYCDNLTNQFNQLTADEAATLGLELELETVDGSRREAIAVSSLVEWDETTQIHTSVIPVSETPDESALSLRENALHEAPMGITIADATREDEPLIYVNDGFVELTGYSREKIIGRNCRFLQGEATREEPVAKIREAIDEEQPVTVTLRNYRKDGSMFWNRVTLSPVRDESGTLTHFLGFQEDVSETKVYEKEKSLFEQHAAASDQVMFITDTDGTIEYVNPAFEQVTGYSAAEAIGENPRLLKSETHDEQFYEELWETIQAGDVWEGTLTNRTKYGELYQVNQTVIPVTDDRGEITHFTAVERDITDERLTEQVLNVLNRVLRHNVRTSINVIDGYAESLESELENDKQRAATQAIRERTDDLKELNEQLTAIRNLLGDQEDPSPLDVSHIENIVDRARQTYDDASISLTVHPQTERAIKNGNVFQVALETAIENAVTHTDQETPQIDISVHESEDGETIPIEIADNGPGIPEEEWRIIQEGTETPLQHTSGIGLWIMYWSVVALGGSVERTANEPRGTVLRIMVPLSPDDQ